MGAGATLEPLFLVNVVAERSRELQQRLVLAPFSPGRSLCSERRKR